MKVYDFKTILEDNGISYPENSELFRVVYCLESIGVVVGVKGPWIAGGALLRTFLGEPITTDIDFFFSCEAQYNEAYEKMKKNALLLTETKFSSSFNTIVEHNGKETEYKIQLVKFVYAEKAIGIINVFDIDICEMAFDGKRILVPEQSLQSIMSRQLRIHVDRITNPAHTFKRVVKYVSRGFKTDEKNLQEFANKFIIRINSDENSNIDKY